MGARLTRVAIVVVVGALLVPLVAFAGSGDGRKNTRDEARMFFATDSAGKLLRFKGNAPEKARSRAIRGLAAGVTIIGIDFRPATGDLYALGSDKVVYRINPWTAIAVAEGPAFETAPSALNGNKIGFDFNPTVDKIRVTSDADDNIRLDPDPGSLLMKDTALTPASVTVVGSAYTNSSFAPFSMRPTATMLFALDVGASPDRIWLQNPANAGTLVSPVNLDLELGSDAGFDIAGSANAGYVAGTPQGAKGARFYAVDVVSGKTRSFGRIGGGDVTITGLAAVQD